MKTKEGGGLTSTTTSKSTWPTLQPAQTTGDLPSPPPPAPGLARAGGNRGGPKERSWGPSLPPTTQDAGVWLAALQTWAFTCLRKDKLPSSSLASERLGAKSQPPYLEGEGRQREARTRHHCDSCAESISARQSKAFAWPGSGDAQALSVSHSPHSVRRGCNYPFSAASEFQSCDSRQAHPPSC